jgi:hypothetical protein
MQDHTDDQRRIMRDYIAAADAVGGLIATLRIRGAADKHIVEADRILQAIQAALTNFANTED